MEIGMVFFYGASQLPKDLVKGKECSMSKYIDRPRYLCALGGAIGTLNALPNTIPILHAAGGCGGNLANALNGGAGYLGSSYCGGQALPSTNVYEQHIVFGGEARLAEQIENTLKLINGSLYFVVTGCMVDMIGDDTKNIARQFASFDKNKTVLAAETGGFKGNSFKGYDIVLETLFKEYVKVTPTKTNNLVNLWGVVPVQDVFWKGNLRALKELLGRLGLKVNTFFGDGETLDTLKNAGKASLNIVVSDIFGISAADTFEEVHGTPYISAPFPIGVQGSRIFLQSVADALGIDQAFVDRAIREEEEYFYSYYERLADVYNDLDLQRYAVVVGDANYTQALTRFLADDLGWLPELVVITDMLDEDQQEQVRARFTGYTSGLTPNIVFDTDTASVSKHFNEHWPRNRGQRYYDSFSPAFVLGSAFDRDFAADINAPHLSVTFPISNRVVLDRAYAGYRGALCLTEDIFGALVNAR
jgi:nitrogenase molybdenum-iron protein beta chain